MNREKYTELRSKLSFAPKNLKSLTMLCFNWLLLASAFALYRTGNSWASILSLFMFSVQVQNSNAIVHECGHFSFVSNRKFNIVIGHIASLTAYIPFFSRQFEHLGHHKWAGSTQEKFTQNGFKNAAGMTPKKLAIYQFAWSHWVPIFAFSHLVYFWKLCFMNSVPAANARQNKASGSFSIIVYLVAIAILRPGILDFIFFLGTLYGSLIISEFVNLPHHHYEGFAFVDSEKPIPFSEHENYSRSCEAIPFFSRMIILNFNYHNEHHFYPNLPWHELGVFHQLLKTENVRMPAPVNEFAFTKRRLSVPFMTVFGGYQKSADVDVIKRESA